MCTREHWDAWKDSPAYHEAKKFALELAEFAKTQGYKPKHIKIKTKEQVIKEGYSKADAQVVWTDGPKNWANELEYIESNKHVYYIPENGHTVSFYLS